MTPSGPSDVARTIKHVPTAVYLTHAHVSVHYLKLLIMHCARHSVPSQQQLARRIEDSSQYRLSPCSHRHLASRETGAGVVVFWNHFRLSLFAIHKLRMRTPGRSSSSVLVRRTLPHTQKSGMGQGQRTSDLNSTYLKRDRAEI